MNKSKFLPIHVADSPKNFVSKCDASKYKVISKENLLNISKNRKIFIFGAGQKGRGFYKAALRNGIQIYGFIDSNLYKEVLHINGLPVMSPQEFANFFDNRSTFVILASVDSKTKEMTESLERLNFLRGLDYLTIQDLCPFYPVIEVTGVCNLRCPSCIRSSKNLIPNGKMMTFDTYAKVIHKMVQEIPFLYLVDLYIWGEPILNPEISKMIKLNNELGVATGLSTNLNNIKNLDSVLESKPDQLRVSVSGLSAETYEVTHAGGKWEKVKTNLIKLADLVNKYQKYTSIEFYFHIYKHNVHEIKQAIELCRNFGFNFHPALGIILSSDLISRYRETKKLTPEAENIRKLLVLDIDELLQMCEESNAGDCILTRVIPVINWDLSVMPCCNYSYTNTISNNYLDISLGDLINLRTYSTLCFQCQQKSLHRWNDQVSYNKTINKVLSLDKN